MEQIFLTPTIKNCTFKMNGAYRNVIFNLESNQNCDNGFYSWVTLRNTFFTRGLLMSTWDMNSQAEVAFELHVNIQNSSDSIPAYLLMLESAQVCPESHIPSNWERYRKIFTWHDDLVDGDRFIKINFPNPIVKPEVDGWDKRDRFCCLISGNKTLAVRDERILYSERVKVIRWFEHHAPQDFDLYGVSWDIPVVPAGLSGKLLRRFWLGLSRFVKLHPFPSYRGRVQHKREVLQRTRYSICYENVRDLPGYITEKIFDSFFSGCVPVYWGASNVTDYIPADCFIDRRQFSDTEAVYRHLKSISEEEFRGYQQRIAAFLASDAARPFNSEGVAETIVNTIVKDLDR